MIDWKGQDGQDVADLWNEGKSCGEISVKFGVTRSTVSAGVYRLKERGLITRSGVAMDLWSDSDDETLKVLRAAGKTNVQIAAAIGRTLGSVKAKIERMVYAGHLKRVADGPGRPKTFGVRAITFVKRDEERVSQNIIAGQGLLSRIDAAMTGEGVPLLEMRKFQCHFLTGGAPDWRMCGEPAKDGSYCPKCRAIVYTRAA